MINLNNLNNSNNLNNKTPIKSSIISDDRDSLLVTEFMTRGVLSFHKNETTQVVAKKMVDLGVASFIVLDDNDKPIGIVTEKDLVRKVVAKNLIPSEVAIESIMSSPMKKLPSTATIKEAINEMTHAGIKHMVIYEVLETGESVVGMFSFTNLVRADLSLNNLIIY